MWRRRSSLPPAGRGASRANGRRRSSLWCGREIEAVMELDPATTSFLGLFLNASVDVQVVMGVLALASLWSWAVIISFGFKLSAARKAIEKFDSDYREADDIDEFHRRSAGRDQ